MVVDDMVEDTFYTLYHDYGTTVTIKTLSKRNVNTVTGEREGDPGFTADAVFTPTGLVNSYFARMLGRDDEYTTVFMVRTLVEIMPSDTLIHGNIHYRDLKIQRYNSVSLVVGKGDK